MGVVTIDLGTTNIKVSAYSDLLELKVLESLPVSYGRNGAFVEFDPDEYYENIETLIASVYAASGFDGSIVQIVLTGQAESLVVLDKNGVPLRKGISWLDMRSSKECEELTRCIGTDRCYEVTGQPEFIPTWPLTKILWLKRNEPEVFSKTGKFLLLKDYIIYRLTGNLVGEHSIYPFSCYFDVKKKQYWGEALDVCGVSAGQLPTLVEPCSIAGEVSAAVCERTRLPKGSYANVGTLDHFAGMIGTGNISEGIVSESAGTVSSIATFVSDPFSSASRIPFYCGPFPESYIYLPVCESGGISLEWFAEKFLSSHSFREIDDICSGRTPDQRLTFLPYLTGVNPPEFDPDATGVFYGLTAANDAYDLALAVMYGVACLLRKNIECFRAAGIRVERILSTGGGAKSALWSQIKADICGLPVVVPENSEAPSLGAAIIGAVRSGAFSSYEEAVQKGVRCKMVYNPTENRTLPEHKYSLFCNLYDSLRPIFAEKSRLS